VGRSRRPWTKLKEHAREQSGGRPNWSPDGRRLASVEKNNGDGQGGKNSTKAIGAKAIRGL
jgi:Tol biopolymer transport system component